MRSRSIGELRGNHRECQGRSKPHPQTQRRRNKLVPLWRREMAHFPRPLPLQLLNGRLLPRRQRNDCAENLGITPNRGTTLRQPSVRRLHLPCFCRQAPIAGRHWNGRIKRLLLRQRSLRPGIRRPIMGGFFGGWGFPFCWWGCSCFFKHSAGKADAHGADGRLRT